MTVFRSDRASADLSLLEESVLRGLASLGYNTDLVDLTEFCVGFVDERVNPNVETVVVDADSMHAALCSLDALGWCAPKGDDPLTATSWYITGQGRVALEGVESNERGTSWTH